MAMERAHFFSVIKALLTLENADIIAQHKDNDQPQKKIKFKKFKKHKLQLYRYSGILNLTLVVLY